MSFGALQRNRAELVAVGMITTVGAKGKIFGQAEMPHLDARALRRVAGQQAKCGIRIRGQMIDQGQNPINHASCKCILPEIVRKSLMINRQVICKRILSELHSVVAAYPIDDAAIGSTREIEIRPIIAKDLTRRLFQCRHAGTAGVDQRSIDVEEVQHRRRSQTNEISGLRLARLLEFHGIGGFDLGSFIRHFVVKVIRGIVIVVIVFFHELAVEEMELALALMRWQR
ncbi:MAG: hypothetical protein RLZ22_1378 [Verrucomicrobiota bacterium]